MSKVLRCDNNNVGSSSIETMCIDKENGSEIPFIEDDVNSEEDKCSNKGLVGCLPLDEEDRAVLKKISSFIGHFLTVLLVLFGSAFVFAYFENKDKVIEVFQGKLFQCSNTSIGERTYDNNKSSRLNNLTAESQFWKKIEGNLKVTVNKTVRDDLYSEFKKLVLNDPGNTATTNHEDNPRNNCNWFVLRKWFYFVIITSTTIGYGDLAPKTSEGRLFFIFFSLLAIILFMSLLKRCGGFISYLNRSVYSGINRYICMRGKKNGEARASKIKEAYLSLFSLILIFTSYLGAGVLYGTYLNPSKQQQWSLTDNAYFWVVTFSTVGFGDLLIPLDDEIDQMYFYIPYRVFGLSIIAAILDALCVCMIEQEKELKIMKAKLNEMAIKKINVKGLVKKGNDEANENKALFIKE